jgi:hypothetical protein
MAQGGAGDHQATNAGGAGCEEEMKKWIRFECGDIICAKVKKLNNREYRVTTNHGWLFVSWKQVFDTQQQARANRPRASIGDYVQVFRKPVTIKPCYKHWYIDDLNGTKLLDQTLQPSDFAELMSVLEPQNKPSLA